MLHPDKLQTFAQRFTTYHEDHDEAVDMLFAAEREIRHLRKMLEDSRKAVDYVGGDEAVRNICRRGGLTMRYEAGGGEVFTWAD